MEQFKHYFEAQFQPDAKILVVGDLILDEYLFGEVKRISPEAPIPVVLLREGSEDFRLGGAANVALNIASLGIQAVLIGGVGSDPQGDILSQQLREKQVAQNLVFLDRQTTWKRRVLGQNKQMLRIDKENSEEISAGEEEKLKSAFLKELETSQLVILSDYGKGLLTASFLQFAIKQCQQKKIKVLVDPKGKDYQKYSGASVITPNKREAEEATLLTLNPAKKEELERCANQLIKTANLEASIITLGKNGVCLKEKGKEVFLAKTRARSVYDITGAGDTFIACLGYALVNDYSYLKAVELANIAAGIKVAKQGTKEVTRDEILEELSNLPSSVKKIFEAESLPLLQQQLEQATNTTLLLLNFTAITLELLHLIEKLPGESLLVAIWRTKATASQANEQAHLAAALESVRWVMFAETEEELKSFKVAQVYFQKGLVFEPLTNWREFSFEF